MQHRGVYPKSSRARRPCFEGLLVGAAVALFAPGAVLAEPPPPTAGQLTPPTFAPPPPPAQGFSLPNSPTGQAPPGAAESFITPGDIVVEDLDPALADEARALIDPVRHQRVSVAALYDLAGKIQEIYAAHGYFLTRVVIPPQEARDGGVLTLRVAEGYIEKVDVSALAPAVRHRARAVLARLVGRKRLGRAEFYRALRLASETPGLRLQGNLSPAATDLGVTLTVTGVYHLVDGQVAVDNALPGSLGHTEIAASGTLNSPLHLGEQFYFSASAVAGHGGLGSDNPDRTLAAGVQAPILNNGLKANFEYAWSATEPITPAGELATASRYRRASFRLSYPWIKSETGELDTRFALDVVDEVNRALDPSATLYHDQLSVLRFGVDANHDFSPGTKLSASVDLSHGIDAFGARGAAQATTDEPISTAGANDVFTKVEVRARLRQDLGSRLTLDLSAKGQLAPSGPLMNSEKFVIGGPDDLSGFTKGEFVGDKGWAARGEWQYRLPTPNRLSLTPYLFAAYGRASLWQPTAVESAAIGADSFGLGVRGSLAPARAMPVVVFGLEGGRGVIDDGPAHSDTWRVNVSASLSF